MTAKSSPTARRLWIGLIIVGLILILFFGMRAARSFWRVQHMGPGSDAADIDAIRGWMTIPYIAHTYHIPPEYLFDQLQIPIEGNQEKSLADLNSAYFNGAEGEIMTRIKQAIRDFQTAPPPPRKP